MKKRVRVIAIRAQAAGVLHSFTIENRMAVANKANARLRFRMGMIIPRLVPRRGQGLGLSLTTRSDSLRLSAIFSFAPRGAWLF